MSFAALGLSQAAQPGHGRVSSGVGTPLQVTVPVRGLTSDDLKVLSASVADPAAWAQAGLTLPAPIETLSVSVEPGMDLASRQLVLRSTQAVNRPVIDVLIRLTTASGTRTIQSSYLVLTSDISAGSASTVRVARGDTLYAIALSKAVPGADIYQVMWAIYEANPQAFISENMNLLRADVALNIPDAATIRAVDPRYARAMFAKHDQAFRARRGTGQVAATVPAVVTATTQAGSVTTPASPTAPPVNAGDQVRLASTNPADLQADQRVAAENELREMQARVEALQKNVEDLQDALQKSQAVAAAASRQAGAAMGANILDASGASGGNTTSSATVSQAITGSSGSSISASAPTGASGALGASGSAGVSTASGPASAMAAGPASVPDTRNNTSGAAGAAASANSVNADARTDTASPVAEAVTTRAPSAPAGASLDAKGSAPTGIDVKAANEVKTNFTKLKEYASDHVLGLVLGISALLALLIAFLLRRAGQQEQTEGLEGVPNTDPALASAFDQKLQSIDLNLSDDDKTVSSPSKSGA